MIVFDISLLSLKYGRIVCNRIDKDSFLDFEADDAAAKQWGELVYGEWAKCYSTYVKNVQRIGTYADYWNNNDHNPLLYYCGCVYDNANKYYRLNESGNEFFDSLKTEINAIIETAPRISENIVVYRALGRIDFWDFKRLNDLRIPFVELGFMSTSLSASILTRKNDDPSSDFSACHYALRIFVPKGAMGIYVDEIGKRIDNMSRGELEILFPSSSKLYMMSYPYKQWGKTVIDCCFSI